MTAFLRDQAIIDTIRAEVGEADRADLAVAFWGDGVLDQLKLPAKIPLRIICDLDSGACNPHELIKLLKRGNVTIRAKRRFHAKVYLTPKCAIVSSANASANGLGEEGSEASGTIEAGLATSDPTVIADVQRWFEEQWDDAPDDVDEDRAKSAIALWELRRKAKEGLERQLKRMTIMRQYANKRSWFNQRRIWVHSIEDEGEPFSDALESFDLAKANFYDKKELEDAAIDKYGYPFYHVDVDQPDLENYHPGDFMLEFFWTKSKAPKFNCIWQIDRNGRSIPVSPKTKLIVVHKRDRAAGLSFPKVEQNAVSNWLVKHHKDKMFSTLLSELPKTFSFRQ